MVERIDRLNDIKESISTNLNISIGDRTDGYRVALVLDEKLPIIKDLFLPEMDADTHDFIADRSVKIYKGNKVKCERWYTDIEDSYGDIVYFETKELNTICGGKYICSYDAQSRDAGIKPIGVILFEIELPFLEEALDEKLENVIYELKATDGRIVLMSNEMDGVEKNEYYIYSKSLFDSGLLYEAMIPQSIVNKTLYGYILTVLFMALFALFCGYVIIHIFSKKITKPIVRLSRHMQESSGLHKIEYDVCDTVELDEIYKTYNHMVEKIISHTEQQKKMEFKLLQAQINPHFIYNVLDNIGCRLLLQGEDEMVECLSNVVDYMRYNIRREDERVTILEDVHMLKTYIRIYKYQYEHEITLMEDIPPELETMKIPKMLMQPLAENSVLHGILPEEKGGFISIVCRNMDDGFVEISVTDSGTKCDVERVNMHIEGKLQFSKDTKHGMGIRNINERINVIYGENCGLYYKKSPEGYTVAVMRIKKSESNK